jgi:hypothetical protein
MVLSTTEIIVSEAFLICSSKRALVSGFSAMDATRVRVRVRMRESVQAGVRVWAS